MSQTMNHRRSRNRVQAGFTLVEAMIVIAIFGLLTTIALPSFSEFGRSQRIRAAGFDLVGDLLLARSEAIKRAGDVSVSGSAGGWSNGWTVTVEGGAADGTVLQRRQAVGTGVDVVEAPAALTFDRNGRIAGGGVVRLGIADKVAGVTRRCIVVELSGMARSLVGECT
jgi:type IV fimbrial biogenesis protein FimT